jgi:quercetin dioxygenase-like cupin family protein
MSGSFRPAGDVQRVTLDWGTLGWVSHPPSTGAQRLTVMEVTLEPEFGHDFHKHPDQEEVICVRSGRIQQWLERDRRELGPGDSVFIPADLVHASFTDGDKTALLVVTLGPCVGEIGYELVDVSGDEPWSSLRG